MSLGGVETMTTSQDSITRVTYGYLRWLMILLPAMLFVVTAVTAWQQGELEPSISAYYGGPVRDVFVGVMIATAACMVAYQGTSLLEDYALNGAGFYAVFVALVPTNLDETMSQLRANPTPDGVTPDDYVAFLRTALTTVLALCVLLVIVELSHSQRLAGLWNSHPLNKAFLGGTSIALALFLWLAMSQLWLPNAGDVTMNGIANPFGSNRLRIHDLAAILLIAALAVVVFTHAFPKVVANLEKGQPPPTQDPKARMTSMVIFIAMVVGPFAAIVVHRFAPDHTVIFLEWWEIFFFSLFWAVETSRVSKLSPSGAPLTGGHANVGNVEPSLHEQDA
jgi:hypothetical protein